MDTLSSSRSLAKSHIKVTMASSMSTNGASQYLCPKYRALICKWCHLQVVSFASGGGSQKIDFALEFKLSKTLSGLVYFVPYLYGGRSPPPITAIQNTQAHSEFLTTSIPKQKPRLHKNYLDPLVNEPPCLTF